MSTWWRGLGWGRAGGERGKLEWNWSALKNHTVDHIHPPPHYSCWTYLHIYIIAAATFSTHPQHPACRRGGELSVVSGHKVSPLSARGHTSSPHPPPPQHQSPAIGSSLSVALIVPRSPQCTTTSPALRWRHQPNIFLPGLNILNGSILLRLAAEN